MQLQPGSERIFADDATDPLDGEVRWSPAKSLWLGSMTAMALAFAPLCFSWSALFLFIIDGVAAQGYNVGIAGLISMGESWHNNHHAFPGSAKLGLLPGQIDAGWWLIKSFALLGLATT